MPALQARLEDQEPTGEESIRQVETEDRLKTTLAPGRTTQGSRSSSG